MRDTFEASVAATGAWLRCLYKMRLSVTPGRISRPIANYARLFGSPVDQAKVLIEEINALGIGDAVTESNGDVTLTNRRMYRAFEARNNNAERQARYRERHQEIDSNGNVTNGLKSDVVVVERSIVKKEVKQQRKKVPTTRIPDPFPLTDEMIEWALKEVPELRLVEAHENFIEYYTNLSTAKAEKVDWVLTWKKGMKLALKWQQAEKVTMGGSTDADCSVCNNERRIRGNLETWPCEKCCPLEYRAWLKSRGRI